MDEWGEAVTIISGDMRTWKSPHLVCHLPSVQMTLLLLYVCQITMIYIVTPLAALQKLLYGCVELSLNHWFRHHSPEDCFMHITYM